jgi:magnesium-transporting ATPase (P-type)
MANDLRKFAKNTNTQLVIGGFVLLFVVGLGLIALLYSPQAALVGLLCMLGGLVPIGLVALLMVGLNVVVKKIKKE